MSTEMSKVTNGLEKHPAIAAVSAAITSAALVGAAFAFASNSYASKERVEQLHQAIASIKVDISVVRNEVGASNIERTIENVEIQISILEAKADMDNASTEDLQKLSQLKSKRERMLLKLQRHRNMP